MIDPYSAPCYSQTLRKLFNDSFFCLLSFPYLKNETKQTNKKSNQKVTNMCQQWSTRIPNSRYGFCFLTASQKMRNNPRYLAVYVDNMLKHLAHRRGSQMGTYFFLSLLDPVSLIILLFLLLLLLPLLSLFYFSICLFGILLVFQNILGLGTNRYQSDLSMFLLINILVEKKDWLGRRKYLS